MARFLKDPSLEQETYLKVWIDGEEHFAHIRPGGAGGYECWLFNSAAPFNGREKFYSYGETGISTLEDLYNKLQTSVKADFLSSEILFDPIEIVSHDEDEFSATLNQKGA